MSAEKIYIVMPAYNEEANINAVVEQWHPIAVKINTLQINRGGVRSVSLYRQ